MNIYRYIILLLFCFIASLSFGQATDEIRFASRVKQLDDFIARFNLKKDLLGNDVSSDKSLKINGKEIPLSRELMIFSLIDSRKIITKSDSDFVSYVNKGAILLSFYDEKWEAEVTCSVNFKNKEQKLMLVMRNEVSHGMKSKWVIVSAKADFLNVISKSRDTLSIISPVSNDINFSDLSKVFNQPENLMQYIGREVIADDFSVLLGQISSGNVKFNSVADIQYIFRQIDGWEFRVKNFNRPSGNSGWLISEIVKINK